MDRILHGAYCCTINTILASSSESEDGGVSTPPCKKQRLEPRKMQTNGCPPQSAQNGVELGERNIDAQAEASNVNGANCIEQNGQENGDAPNTLLFNRMSKNEQDLVRLIGQYLKSLGLRYV